MKNSPVIFLNIMQYDMRKKGSSGMLKAFISFANKASYTSFKNIRFEKITCEYFSQQLLFWNLGIWYNTSLNANSTMSYASKFLFYSDAQNITIT